MADKVYCDHLAAFVQPDESIASWKLPLRRSVATEAAHSRTRKSSEFVYPSYVYHFKL